MSLAALEGILRLAMIWLSICVFAHASQTQTPSVPVGGYQKSTFVSAQNTLRLAFNISSAPF